ncbi:MAG: polyprenol phosphomannose-dependent alpha 1,6 mannosyltransferase MptB [Actinomycetota bacterium]|nr:polyprenol phosphomannose-dependent alpha 1,6 mannosyltransferase MptB [Actinomycetota bacterium]
MSIQRPLGATQGGSIELTSPSLDVARRASRSGVGLLALCGILVTATLVSIAAAHTDLLLPESVRPVPAWLAGPFRDVGLGLGAGGLISVLAVMFVSYLIAVQAAHRLSARAVLMTIAAFHALVLFAPPLLSTDVFSYQAYARMGAVYGLNPYLAGPHAIQLDPLYAYIGAKWVGTPTAYGPVFTALSYVLAPLSVASSALAYKSMAAVASLGTVALVWNAARLRGVDPVKAAALVGLNPLVVLYGVGGGHNDLLMLALLVAGVSLLLSERPRAGGAAMVLGAGVKLTACLYIPFALADAWARGQRHSRRELAIGLGLTGALLAVAGVAVFGSGPLQMLMTVAQNQSKGDWYSISGFISIDLGLGTVGHVTGYVLAVGFAIVTFSLLRRVWRGELDWIAAAGWATFAMLVTASFLLPWYVAWLMPFAALGRDPRLWRTALATTGVILGIQLLEYIPHAAVLLGR